MTRVLRHGSEEVKSSGTSWLEWVWHSRPIMHQDYDDTDLCDGTQKPFVEDMVAPRNILAAARQLALEIITFQMSPMLL